MFKGKGLRNNVHGTPYICLAMIVAVVRGGKGEKGKSCSLRYMGISIGTYTKLEGGKTPLL